MVRIRILNRGSDITAVTISIMDDDEIIGGLPGAHYERYDDR